MRTYPAPEFGFFLADVVPARSALEHFTELFHIFTIEFFHKISVRKLAFFMQTLVKKLLLII